MVLFPSNFTHYADGSNNALSIQRAIDYAYTQGGGTVYLGQGTWFIETQIVLKEGVSLSGEIAKFDTNNHSLYGTILQIEFGQGDSTDLANVAILAHPTSDIEHIAFYYEDQFDGRTTPLEYGPTIKLYKDIDYLVEPYHGFVAIRDCIFYGSYIAIDARGTDSRPLGEGYITTCRFKDNVFVSFKYSIRLDNVTDWTYLDTNEQQPGFISHNATPGASLRDWVQKNGTFVQLSGICDWVHLEKCSSWATAVGIELNAVQGPITANSCDIDGSLICVYLKGQSVNTNIKFETCTFTAFDVIQRTANVNKFSSHVMVAESNTTAKGISFNNCYLFGPSKGWMWFGNPTVAISKIQLTSCNTDVYAVEGGAYYAVDAGNNNADEIICTNNFFTGLLGTVVGNTTKLIDNNNMM